MTLETKGRLHSCGEGGRKGRYFILILRQKRRGLHGVLFNAVLAGSSHLKGLLVRSIWGSYSKKQNLKGKGKGDVCLGAFVNQFSVSVTNA